MDGARMAWRPLRCVRRLRGGGERGKLNCGRPTEVWEEYVAGLDPTNANSQLKAMIEMQDGAPVVKWGT